MRILPVFLFLTLSGCIWFDDASDVTYQETRPQALLKKYEWFKNAASQLDSKKASIEAFKGRIASMDKGYGGTPRTQWARPDLEQYNTWSSEVAGAVAGYNNLAADYNAQMAKANWAFCNVGDLPAGATEPLPRDFAAYLEN